MTCILRTIHMPPYSFTARFPNHLRKWFEHKKTKKTKTLMVVVAAFYNGFCNCISCANRSVFVGKPDKESTIHLKMGKAYLFLINC